MPKEKRHILRVGRLVSPWLPIAREYEKPLHLKKGQKIWHKRYGIPAKIKDVKEIKISYGKRIFVSSPNRLITGTYDEVGLNNNFWLTRKEARKHLGKVL